MVSDSFSSLSVERFSFSLLSSLHFTKVGREGGWIFKKQVRDPVLLTLTLLIPERSQAGSGQPLLEMMKILLASYRFWLGWGQSALFWCHYIELSLLSLIFEWKLQNKTGFFHLTCDLLSHRSCSAETRLSQLNMYSFMGGGLFCAIVGNILLVVSAVTDYWMQYRLSGNYAHQGLWRYCMANKCYMQTDSIGEAARRVFPAFTRFILHASKALKLEAVEDRYSTMQLNNEWMWFKGLKQGR